MSLKRLKQEIVEELKNEVYNIIEEALIEEWTKQEIEAGHIAEDINYQVMRLYDQGKNFAGYQEWKEYRDTVVDGYMKKYGLKGINHEMPMDKLIEIHRHLIGIMKKHGYKDGFSVRV